MIRQKLLKKRHNRLQRRIKLGVHSPADVDKLSRLKQELNYVRPRPTRNNN